MFFSPVLAEAYIHDLDPVLLPIAGAFAIRWYGLSYLAGFLLAWAILRLMAGSGRIALRPALVTELIFYCVGGVIIGGRLGYCFFYDLPRALGDGYTPLLWSFSGNPPFWGVLRLNEGGMASHGGILGVIIAGWIFSLRYNIYWSHIMDCVAFVCPPGLFFGRIANFINAELWGKKMPTGAQGVDAPWWAVQYPQELTAIAAQRPGMLVDSTAIPRAADIDLVAWREYLPLVGVDQESTRLFQQWVGQMTEQLRAGNESLREALHPILTAYYPSQLIQACAEGLVLFVALAIVWLVPRKPGVVGALFLVIYGVLRIFTEIFRQPDEGVAVIMGLQRGQLLSVLMIVGGLIPLLWVSLRGAPKLGGLLNPSPETKAMAESPDARGTSGSSPSSDSATRQSAHDSSND